MAWFCFNDAFISIVSKAPAKEDSLLVRARRAGDIEKVFGRKTKVVRATDSDYLFRAVITKEDVTRAIQNEVLRIDYPNFKSSVIDDDLHDAYMKVWSAMVVLQDPRPYSEMFKHMPVTNLPPKHDIKAQVATLGADSLLPASTLVSAVRGATGKSRKQKKGK